MKISVLLKITELLIFFRQIWKQPTRVAFGSCISPDQCLQCARSQSQGEQIIRIQPQWLFMEPYGKLPPTNCAVFFPATANDQQSIPTFFRFFLNKIRRASLNAVGTYSESIGFRWTTGHEGFVQKGRWAVLGNSGEIWSLWERPSTFIFLRKLSSSWMSRWQGSLPILLLKLSSGHTMPSSYSKP